MYRIISIFSKKAYIHRRLGGNYTNTLMGEFQLFLFSVTFDVFLLVSMDYFYNENETCLLHVYLLFFHLCFFFFLLHYAACRILGPRPGTEPLHPQWKHGILTTGPSGKSPYFFITHCTAPT